MKRILVGGLARYAQSFYGLLGNRRKFKRAPMSGSVLVTRKGVVVDITHVSSCVDISKRGIGIECPDILAVDGVVQVQSKHFGPRRLARVRYCIRLGDRYRVGLEFIAETQ
jgi:hypothetical protein